MKFHTLLVAALVGAPGLIGLPARAADDLRAVPNGPIHEAFAQPESLPREAPPTVAKAPPRALKEELPNERPDLDGVEWIPGYWDYVPDDNDYVWVSGVWRVPPPDRQWVGGYWAKNDGKWQRVRGYWAPYKPGAAEQEVTYLPQPPALPAQDPGDPPAPGNVYVPGSYAWSPGTSGYTYSPGYWTAAQPGWSWTPQTYAWSPGGYVPSGGYWDYDPKNRGVAFAPQYVPQAYRRQPNYTYTPTQVLSPTSVANYLPGPTAGPRYTYNDPTYVNYGSAPGVRRVPVGPLRRDLAKLAQDLRRLNNLRRQLENKIAGPRKAPHKAGLAVPRPRGRKAAANPPTHPRNHKVAQKPRGDRPNRTAGRTDPKKKPGSRVTRKANPKKPAAKSGGKKPAGKKPQAKAGKGKKSPKSKAGKGKKSPKSKAGKGKKSPKSKAGKGKKGGAKSKAGKGKKGGAKSKAGKGKKGGAKSKAGKGKKGGAKSKAGKGKKGGKSKAGKGKKGGAKKKGGKGKKGGGKKKK
jgi:hypothetical protein